MEQEHLKQVAKLPAEVFYQEELSALKANDKERKPPGWHLSPKAVRTFILGSDGKALVHNWQGKKHSTVIKEKFYGDATLIDRCIVTLAGTRGLMLVGEPGTAKSMLSELLAAAISGTSVNTIQGTAGTTEDQIKYSWNFALLLSEGPSLKSLIPAPIYTGLKEGQVVRFEEITRCQPEIQDTLVSILSDKVMHIPELKTDDTVVYAKKGFNIIATANIRDRGVHEMSSALKRRFNFETVEPIADKKLELKLVMEQTKELLSNIGIEAELDSSVIDLLVTTFHDLRAGRTQEGIVIEKPSSVMSTAEAVAVSLSASLDAVYFGKGVVDSSHIVRNIVGSVLKDSPEDAKKLKHYFDVVVKSRAATDQYWSGYYKAKKWLN